ncbi:alpha/beta hydrolase family protein [Haloactinopolyspora alba]|uniref:Alpha/beta hydrolase family protein n=1 Tax=Haloactinopolyspora alba TaxID=648780 RepID=A0A2P8E7M1_9ACTN|nr:alpha/beta hydrolase [Haloactinopolyspora alba]PSL05459.1 alpha/beta hydrolase family protein [Haloactinopolyspora alba]
MNCRALVGVVLTALVAAGCQADPDENDGQQVDPPDDSTPAPDATEGVDAGLAQYYTQTLNWEDCDEEFQCTTATVPVDYDEPDGDTIELSVLRAPATSEDRMGSLLVNPGGPGASGVEYARVAGAVATEQVREHYDIVGFDPRGVGESQPIDCLDDAELDEFVASDMSPDDESEISEMRESVQDFAEGCKARSGDLLPHVGTDDVARDLDILRAALGDERLNYLGKSYGTYIGAIYADLFPDRVGRMVLDGAMDPTLSSKEMALGQVRGFERALSAFLDWCVEQDNCAAGSTESGARQTIRGFFQQVDEEPLPTSDENRPLTESLAFYGVILPLYLTAAEGYPALNEALAAALNEGDGQPLLTFADIYLERNSSGEYKSNQNEAIVAVNCVDHPSGGTIEDAQASVSEFRKVSPIFGPSMAWNGVGCGTLLSNGDNGEDSDNGEGSDGGEPTAAADIAPTTADGAAPILVVGTTGDPATPYEWAQSLADQLSSGVLLTYEASVHTAYLSGSDCIDKAVDAYLLNGTAPEQGKRCAS